MTPEDERALASWLARPEWPQMRRLIADLLNADIKPLDDLIATTRKAVWRDFSSPDQQ